MLEKIKVKTSFGTLIAEDGGDTNYPGIWISLIEQNEDGSLTEHPLVLVEAHEIEEDNDGYVRAIAFTDLDGNDYTHEVFFTHLRKGE